MMEESQLEQTGEDQVTPTSEVEVLPSTGENELLPPSNEGQELEPDHGNQVQGLTEGIKAERLKRQQLEAELAQIRQMVYQQQQMIQPQQQQPKYDDEQYLNYGAMRDEVGNIVEQKVAKASQMLMNMSEKIARNTHKDFDVVIENYTADLVRTNPSLYNYIKDSADPAETAYILGKSHPKYLETQQRTIAEDVAKKINTNANRPKTLASSGVGGKTTLDDVSKIESMSSDEFESYKSKIKGLT